MSDVHNQATRSYNMSRIRSKDTKPEILVRRFLHSKGLRFRLHDKKLPGKPDIVLPRFKTVIQIHGCFWHGHENCKDYKTPATRTGYWQGKISKNIEKDRIVTHSLEQEHWHVITIWACQLEAGHKEHTLSALLNGLIQK